MRYLHNSNQPVYAPNSYGGPSADSACDADPGWFASGEIMRSAYVAHAEDNDFVQPRNLYQRVLSETDRAHLIDNIVGHMSKGVEPAIQQRALQLWYQVDPHLGGQIAQRLGFAPGISPFTPVGVGTNNH